MNAATREEEGGRAVLAGSSGRGEMPVWYDDLLESVIGRVATGRTKAIAAANQRMIASYWAIGQDILERQGAEGWGAKVIDRLSADLRQRFPAVKGFSPRNLKYMRAFAEAWADEAIVQQAVAQLPWGHHILLLQRLDGADARLWYLQQAVENGWSRSILDLQIDRQLRERSGKAITNFAETLPPQDSDMAQQATKDPYLFDFLEGSDKLQERQVEQGLIDHVEKFLLELGQGFAFVGRQHRLTIGEDDFYLDLLFFHYALNRFVVIELKATRFQAASLAQLGVYMAAIDDQIKSPHHEPTIGLLLCRTKNNLLAEYALHSQTGPIGVAEWAEALETSLPVELAAKLPSIESLEAELQHAELTDDTGASDEVTVTITKGETP